MPKQTMLKTVGYIAVIALVANLILFPILRYSALIFWIILIIIAVIFLPLINFLKKKV